MNRSVKCISEVPFHINSPTFSKLEMTWQRHAVSRLCRFFPPFSPVLFIYLLYNIVLVLPYINMNLPWVGMCSPSWNPLPPPSPSHPSGSSQCTSPKHPVSCIEPGLEIHFTYDNIHISMSFSWIIPPLPLPQSPKYCSIHLCLFCCLTYRVIVTIFLNSIYMH